MKISFKDMNTGANRQIPISAVVKFDYNNTLGGVKRKNLKRLITIYSNLTSTRVDPNKVNRDIAKAVAEFKGKPDDITVDR